jgi:hypothetical protein
LGTASVLAIPNEIDFLATQLYKEGAVWSKLIPNLSSAKVHEELRVKQLISRFAPPPEAEDLPDISLYDLRPYTHVRVYKCSSPVDVAQLPSFSKPFGMPWHRINAEDQMATYFLQERTVVKWAPEAPLLNVDNHLAVVYFDTDSQLLFINSSAKVDGIYGAIISAICNSAPERLPMDEIDSVLAEIEDPRCFSVGLQSTDPLASGDTYKNYMGPNADDSVDGGDTAAYVLGHAMATGKEDGKGTTIGYSASSKLWANKHLQLTEFKDWCESQAKKITSKLRGKTLSVFDVLARPTRADQLTAIPVGVAWHKSVLFEPLRLRTNGQNASLPLAEYDLLPNRGSYSTAGFEMDLRDISKLATVEFHIGNAKPYANLVCANILEVVNEETGEVWGLLDFLNSQRPEIVLADGSRTDGTNYNRPATRFNAGILQGDLLPVDWATEKVPIDKELNAPAGFRSIQDWSSDHLRHDYELVVCDHSRGEVADFVAFQKDGGIVRVCLCHCKGSSKIYVGDRETDLYDLCAQTIKCARFLRSQELMSQLSGRLDRGISQIRKGDRELFDSYAELSHNTMFQFALMLVQPGISMSGLGVETSGLLGFAKDSCKSRVDRFTFVCSA